MPHPFNIFRRAPHHIVEPSAELFEFRVRCRRSRRMHALRCSGKTRLNLPEITTEGRGDPWWRSRLAGLSTCPANAGKMPDFYSKRGQRSRALQCRTNCQIGRPIGLDLGQQVSELADVIQPLLVIERRQPMVCFAASRQVKVQRTFIVLFMY